MDTDAIDNRLHRPPRLLLINPRFEESFWSFRWALDTVLAGKAALNPPLGLATLAALTPPDWEVRIVDENVEPVPLDPDVDMVGICGMAIQFPRQRALMAHYRRRGYLVVVGGSYASLCPEAYEGLADVVVSGEAEYIWPQFCRDHLAGRAERLYRETGEVDLEDSPVPRFDLLKLDRYTRVSLQFSRGCPYQCEFCDIIVMFGRKPRTKSPEQVGRELDALREQGARNVFFVDDNLIGHRPRAKALLEYLEDYQRRHRYRFQFGVEASINLASDRVLLDLFRRANVSWAFIGIESPDAGSLAEANKSQNLKGDILQAVQTLHANGIEVLGGFIVGFDNDTVATFEKQYRFIVDSGIQVAMVGLLTALPKTPLYRRLEQENRLIVAARADNNTQGSTNFLPKGMTADEMSAGFVELHRRLSRDEVIAERIVNKMRHMKAAVAGTHYGAGEALGIVARFLWRGVLPGGPARIRQVLHTLRSSRPAVWPVVVADWIAGLSLQSYVERHLLAGRAVSAARVEPAPVRRLRAALPGGAVAVDPATSAVTVTLASMTANVGPDRLIRRLVRLARSGAPLSIRLDALCAEHLERIRELLDRLSRYADRVTLSLHDTVARRIQMDLSAFHLALDEH